MGGSVTSSDVRVVCVPVQADGGLDPRWGRAARVAIARVTAGEIVAWDAFPVGWDVLHDAGEGNHHARVVRFLREHEVQIVVASHMGQGMVHTLGKMGIQLHLGAGGDARDAVLAALSTPSS